MSAEIWAVVTMGIVILVAIAASHRALRREIRERTADMRRELSQRIDGLDRRVDELAGCIDELSECIREVQRDVSDLCERLGRIEGFPEAVGLKRWRKGGRGNGKQGRGPVQP